jgi:hypothetical protein
MELRMVLFVGLVLLTIAGPARSQSATRSSASSRMAIGAEEFWTLVHNRKPISGRLIPADWVRQALLAPGAQPSASILQESVMQDPGLFFDDDAIVKDLQVGDLAPPGDARGQLPCGATFFNCAFDRPILFQSLQSKGTFQFVDCQMERAHHLSVNNCDFREFRIINASLPNVFVLGSKIGRLKLVAGSVRQFVSADTTYAESLWL